MEKWLGSSLNQIQGWTTLRESYSSSRALEQGSLLESVGGRRISRGQSDHQIWQRSLCFGPSLACFQADPNIPLNQTLTSSVILRSVDLWVRKFMHLAQLCHTNLKILPTNVHCSVCSTSPVTLKMFSNVICSAKTRGRFWLRWRA